MQKSAVALAFAVVALLLPVIPTVSAAAPANPKVVIIVGATEGTTASYRRNADVEYAEAIKYTTNVVKVYSPNATWAAVKAATKGASIVIYHGHGNGWPSPYTYDPAYTTKDGFGLNKVAGAGDSNNTYYGEPYIDDLELAPNAVVLFGNLCYASGNGEPGSAEPTVTVAKQRADNYASAFIKAGARGVIADGHMGLSYYIRALFTTHQSLEGLWRAAPNFKNHVISYASSRSPGYSAMLDPDQASSGYYRSVVGRLSLTTDEVTGASYASTDATPAKFVVPGAAIATVDADLYGDVAAAKAAPDSTPTAVLPAGTAVRVDAVAGTDSAGGTLYSIHTLAGSQSGVAAAAQLAPRDSVGPAFWEIDTAGGAFSPNGDGISDNASVSGRFSETVSWKVEYRKANGDPITNTTGTGPTFASTWNGKISNAPAPEGTYGYRITASDPWGNAPLDRSGTIVLDRSAPTLSGYGLETGPILTFSPNGDGVADQLTIPFTTDEPGSVDVTVKNGGGSTVRTFSGIAPGGTASTAWDGMATNGSRVADGVYTIAVRPRDAAGNRGTERTAQAAVYSALSKAALSATLFYPHDADALAKSTKSTFTLLSPATVTWTISNASGAIVYTRYDAQPLAAGAYSYTWSGKNQAGVMAPRGRYTIRVTATDGTLSATHAKVVLSDGFKMTVSDTTPARGQSITLTVVTAETLSTTPRVTVTQPGVTSWSVATTKVATGTYRVTIKFKSGSTGTATLKVSARDTGGGTNWARLTLPLH